MDFKNQNQLKFTLSMSDSDSPISSYVDSDEEEDDASDNENESSESISGISDQDSSEHILSDDTTNYDLKEVSTQSTLISTVSFKISIFCSYNN